MGGFNPFLKNSLLKTPLKPLRKKASQYPKKSFFPKTFKNLNPPSGGGKNIGDSLNRGEPPFGGGKRKECSPPPEGEIAPHIFQRWSPRGVYNSHAIPSGGKTPVFSRGGIPTLVSQVSFE